MTENTDDLVETLRWPGIALRLWEANPPRADHVRRHGVVRNNQRDRGPRRTRADSRERCHGIPARFPRRDLVYGPDAGAKLQRVHSRTQHRWRDA